jgi:hypothetical protein
LGVSSEVHMAALTFSCPLTGRAIQSGVETDPTSLSRVRLVSIRVRCPHCGSQHDVKMSAGYLTAGGGRVRGPAIARRHASAISQYACE